MAIVICWSMLSFAYSISSSDVQVHGIISGNHSSTAHWFYLMFEHCIGCCQYLVLSVKNGTITFTAAAEGRFACSSCFGLWLMLKDVL